MKTTFLKSVMVALGVLLSVHANADENGILIDGVYYNLITSTKTATVVNGSTSYTGEVTIPASVNYEGEDYTVLIIAMEAFKNCTGLTAVSIGSNVTTISEQAFYQCSHLTSVTVPDCVTSIGKQAFAECWNLATVVIGDGVKTIGDNAFYHCNAMNQLTLGKSVETIGANAFDDCRNLTSVAIPPSVTYFGKNAFLNCNKLTAVHITDLAAWCGVNDGGDGNPLYRACHLYLNGAEVKDLVIPDGVKRIGYGAFRNCDGLRTVTIPKSVTDIKDWAFSVCDNLASVSIEGDNTVIGQSAFANCNNLTTLNITGSVASLGTNAFQNCSKLNMVNITDLAAWCQMTLGGAYANPLDYSHRLFLKGEEVKNLVIPNDVTIIKDRVFEYCTNLQTVSIPNTVTSIKGYCFSGCSKLTSVSIPEGVTSIGEKAFYDCSSMTSVDIPSTVTSIGKDAFSGCTALASVGITDLTAWTKVSFGSETSNPLYYASTLKMNGEEVADLVIPEGISSIGYAFKNWKNLRSVVIGNDVTSIGSGAFKGCKNLTSVTIGSSVISIGNEAFYDCTGLQNLTIGNSVTSIGVRVFYNCGDLRSIVVVKGNSKYDSRNNCNALIETATNKLLLGCRNTVIPETVTTINEGAFYGCTGLTYISFPNSVTSFDTENSRWRTADKIFYGCNNLKEVEFHNKRVPAGATNITQVFGDAYTPMTPNIETIILGKEVTTIDGYAFSRCYNVQTVISYIQEPFAYSTNSFDFQNVHNTCKLIVPAGTRDAYIAKGWTESIFKGGVVEADPNSFAMADQSVNCGKSVTIPIEMNNVTPITAFQFEVVLPEGITWEDCKLAGREEDHVLSAKKQASGIYVVTAISMGDENFSGNSGAVAKLTLNVDKEQVPGLYKLNIKNVELTTEEGQAVHPLDVSSTLSVKNFTMGDTNGDGDITITDAVAIISYILGNNVASFVSNAADVNDDGDITITDAVAIIKMVLNGETSFAKVRSCKYEELEDFDW